MPTQYNSTQFANQLTIPLTEAKPYEFSGKKRILYAYYLTDASAAPVAGDYLILGKLPAGARVTSAEVIVPASFVTSSAKIGYGTVGNAGTFTAVDDDRWGSAVDLSSVGRKQFLTVAADADYVTTAEVAVALTFVTGDPAEAKAIAAIIEYVVD